MSLTTIPHPERVVDVVFPVAGDTIRAGHGYLLYSAVKAVDAALMDEDVALGPIEHLAPLAGALLRVTPATRWRVRCEMRLMPRIMDLAGERLEVGDHVLTLGRATIEVLRPAPVLHSEMVVLRWRELEESGRQPAESMFLGYLYHILRDRGVSSTLVGRRRQISIGAHGVNSGWAVEVGGLTPEQSISMQVRGLGVRRRMGCGMMRPGPLPEWAR